jgi:adenosylcobyric acid synthase
MDLLPMETTFSKHKLTSQVNADCEEMVFLGSKIQANGLRGYEIHMGQTVFLEENVQHPFRLTERANEAVDLPDGLCRPDGLVMGTYIHGIFDNDEYRRALLNAIRQHKKLEPLPVSVNTYAAKQASYNRLADTVRQSLDMKRLHEIMGDCHA